MKTELKDYVFTSTAISLILLITALLMWFLKSLLSPLHLKSLNVLIFVCLFLLIYGAVTIVYTRLLNRIMPLREGDYEMRHSQFTLWKHHAIVAALGRNALRIFFPFFLWPIFYALFGARIGKNVAMAGSIPDPLLVTIKDYGVLGQDSVVTAHAIVFNKLILKPIVIERGATVGINSVIMPGVEVGEYSVVAPGSVVPMDTKIPPNEFWGGVPAKKIKDIESCLST